MLGKARITVVASRFVLGLFVIGPAAVFAACTAGILQQPAAATPAPRDEPYWRELHDEFVNYPEKGKVALLFLGDSITQGWNDNATWQRYYAPRGAARFGIGGDRTQHLLWRIENGELDGMAPRVVVVLIGTNNVGTDPPEEIAAGIEGIINAIRKKLPQTDILVLGVFPRGLFLDRSAPRTRLDPRPAQINAMLGRLANGERVHLLDISSAFMGPDGTVAKSLMPDFLHPSNEGYRAWAEAMEPLLWEMIGDGRERAR